MVEDLSKYIQQIQSETDFFVKAKLIQTLLDKGWRIIDIAKKLNIQCSYVCHILRLNRLPELIIDGYYQKMISLSHLYIISRLKDQKKMIDLYETLLNQDLTVLQTEEKVRDILHNIKSKGTFLDSETKNSLIVKLQNKYTNTKVKIFQSRIKAVLKVEVKGSLEETTKVLQKIIEKLS